MRVRTCIITDMTTQQLPNHIRTEQRTYTTDEGETRTYETEIIALEITLGRETRTVEFKVYRRETGQHMAINDRDFFGRIGMGEKSHACSGTAWLTNGKWEFTTSTRALNRQAYIIGFRDNAHESFKSQHKGSQIAKGVK